MTKDERIDQLSSEVMELREQLRLAQVRAADSEDRAQHHKREHELSVDIYRQKMAGLEEQNHQLVQMVIAEKQLKPITVDITDEQKQKIHQICGGLTERDLFMLREGFKCGRSSGRFMLNEWLDDVIADNGGTVSQSLGHDAKRYSINYATLDHKDEIKKLSIDEVLSHG